MTLKKGQREYKLKKHVDRILAVFLEIPSECSYNTTLVLLTAHEFHKYKRNKEGTPELACFLESKLLLDPIPDRKYMCRVQGFRLIEQ